MSPKRVKLLKKEFSLTYKPLNDIGQNLWGTILFSHRNWLVPLRRRYFLRWKPDLWQQKSGLFLWWNGIVTEIRRRMNQAQMGTGYGAVNVCKILKSFPDPVLSIQSNMDLYQLNQVWTAPCWGLCQGVPQQLKIPCLMPLKPSICSCIAAQKFR